VIKRLRNLRPTQRHPRPVALSQYLDGDLDAAQRRRIEAHIRGCLRCRRKLASLTDTINALSTIASDQPNGLADSIIAALRNEDAPGNTTAPGLPDRSGQPELKVLQGAGQPPLHNDSGARVLRRLRAAVRYCLSWSQLRLTLPITIAAGVVLTAVNMPGTMIHGRIDLGVCLMCATDFLVPFFALNLVLLMLWWAPAQSRGQRRGRRPA
jgi:anti-sigma factor RsiW